MTKIVSTLYMLSLLGSYALPPLAAKKKASLKTTKVTRSGSRTNQNLIFGLIGGACVLVGGSVGVYAWSKNDTSSHSGNLPHNDNLPHSAYSFDFSKSKVRKEMSKTKVPVILRGKWGDLTYEKYDYNKNKRVLVNKKGAKDTEERPDTIFYKDKTVSFDWKKYGVSHKDGYSDKALQAIVRESKQMTHLLLSAGWQAVLNLKTGQKVGKVDDKTIENIENLLTKEQGISKVTFVQTMDQYNALEKREEGELIVVFLRTSEIVGIYNELIKDLKKDVVCAVHMTC